MEFFNSFCLKRRKGASACSSYFFSLKAGEIGTRKLRRSQGTLGLISRLENLPEPLHCAGPRASWWRWNTNCTETPQDTPSQSAARGISSHRAVPMANPPNLSVSPATADVRHGQVYRVASTSKRVFPTLQMSQEQCNLAGLAPDLSDTSNLAVWSQNRTEPHGFWFAERVCVCLPDTNIVSLGSFCISNFPPLLCRTADWKSISRASTSC